MFLLTSISDSLQCSYIFTLGVLLLYLKGILMLLPSCLYLCVYIQCSVNREGWFYMGLANMPSNLQSTLPDALFLLTVLISPGDAELIVMWVLNLGISPKLRGHLCTKWYLEIIFFQAVAESAPSSSPRTGARAYGEGTPASLFPHGHGRLERHFPRLPRWMVTNSRGRGLCEPCTVYHWLLLAALWRGLKAAWPQLWQEKHKCYWIALLLENVFSNYYLPLIC